jgi:hypothetical protein
MSQKQSEEMEKKRRFIIQDEMEKILPIKKKWRRFMRACLSVKVAC